ncbi:MarR family transcriptional regulator [uncultured Roseobacter sp.]|uniref:MarR family winged helix-turn-helix transcriptional regulator n=1 Tax=uncultured Roseobacter sp. TaxID=114847 RepID=UPI002607C883|nr:MarR family transcriptional regulator [uncultured Roseobacter sp.]
MPDPDARVFFEFFNEIGIIEQLSRTLLEARLPEGLIAPHFTVLNHLVRLGDGRAPIDMARAFQVPKTSLTHTLKTLQTRGLVTLAPNPGDGRSKLVWLTDAGRRLHGQTITALGPDFAALAEKIDPADIAPILPVLKAVRVTLDKARDAPQAAVLQSHKG